MNGKMQQVSDQALADGAQRVPGHVLQRTDTGFTTAMRVQVPRAIERISKDAIAEARLMGEDFYYGWDVNTKGGKKHIDGVSIDGAMMLIRQWGNAACRLSDVRTTEEHFLMTATFIDLESGTQTERIYRKHRGKATGNYDQQRFDDMAFSDAQSRAIRNAICHALPRWLQDRCKDAARRAAQQGLDPERERDKVGARAKEFGIDLDTIEKKFQMHLKDFSASDLVTLRALLRTVEDGHASARDLFAVRDRSEPRQGEMPAQEGNERPVDKFAQRIRASWHLKDLQAVGSAIADAKGKGTINDGEAVTLKGIYHETLAMLSDRESQAGAREPGDDSEEAPA